MSSTELDKIADGRRPMHVRFGDRAGRLASYYRQALAIYLCSRMVVGLGVVLGKAYVPLGNDTWVGGAYWYHRLLRWDSEWYKIIASEGYRYNGDPGQTQTVVFFPLYPLICRGVSEILRVDLVDAMLMVSNVAGLAAMMLLFKLVREQFDERIALVTVALISFFPASAFLSAGYTESLALLLMVSFFLLLRNQNFWPSAAVAGLAIATRSSGIALLPVLIFEFLRVRDKATSLLAILPLCLLATAGLWLYMIYLGMTFGHPFAFADGQAAFHAQTSFFPRLISALTLEPFRNIDWADFSPAGLDHWFVLAFIGLICVSSYAGAPLSMTIFAIGVIALPYVTLCGGPAGFTSMGRFNIVSFPLFLVAAITIHRSQGALLGSIGVLSGLLFLYAALFSQWQWVG